MAAGRRSSRPVRSRRIEKYDITTASVDLCTNVAINVGFCGVSGWSSLLSRKSLGKASKQLKEICGQCSLLSSSDVPCILSACLVSLEADSTLRVMPDQFTPDERFSHASVNCHLSTPHDVTCTHILVFPTSATTQVSARDLRAY